MKTDALLEQTSSRPLHHRKEIELKHAPISSMSCWGDAIWRFDHETPGRAPSAALINWDFDLPDGTTLLSPKHRCLLDALKRFIWSLIADPCEHAPPMAVTSICLLSSGFRSLIKWMVANGYTAFGELDRLALDQFKEDLVTILVGIAVGDDELGSDFATDRDEASSASVGNDITWTQAWNHLRIPSLLWRQRSTLAVAGITVMPVAPWDAGELAAALAEKAEGQIMPIPAEVAIPILNSAYRLLGSPASDVERLARLAVSVFGEDGPGGYGKPRGKSAQSRYRQVNRAIADFEFSTIEGEAEPWHRPLGETQVTTFWSGSLSRDIPLHEIRTLISDIRNAASIVIQATAGLRTSEMLAIPSGLNASTGLPNCIEVRPALSGLYEIFLLISPMCKMEEVPQEQEWVLGMRLAGTVELPPAVRALQVLQNLLDPFRSAMGSSAPLLVWFQTGFGLSTNKNNVGPLSNKTFSLGQKNFVVRNVDLSKLPETSARAVEDNDLLEYRVSGGSCIRPHQWRKTLAHFVFNTDNRLLPAISMQFKHLSLAMTADDYLGRNQAIFQALDGVRAQETALLLFELASGKSTLSGRMGKRLTNFANEIRLPIQNLSKGQAWRRLLSISIDEGLRLWFSPHGNCLPLNPAEMRCHQTAGTNHWLNRRPNHWTREPSLCAGCACFVIDAKHIDFWQRRYIDNWLVWKNAEKLGRSGDFRVAFERASQAKALLSQLGIECGTADASAEG